MQFDAKRLRHCRGIGEIFGGAAVFTAVVLLPVLHEQSFNTMALFKQSERCNGGVDASGEANHDGHFLFSQRSSVTTVGGSPFFLNQLSTEYLTPVV